MPITDDELHYRFSKVGGGTQSDPFDSIGGAMADNDIDTDVSENLFPNVTGAQSLAGYIDYAGIYAYNDNTEGLDLIGTKLWIEQQAAAPGDATAIALADEGLDGTMERLSDRETAPATVTFSAPANYAAGLDMGDIPDESFYGIWIRRTIDPATSAYTDDTFELEYRGDTAE